MASNSSVLSLKRFVKKAIPVIGLILLSLPAFCGAAPAAPISFSNLEIAALRDTSVIIQWDTDCIATGQIKYGQDISCGNASPEEELAYWHLMEITGLKEGTTYYYHIRASDSEGRETVSSQYAFTTRTQAELAAIIKAARIDGEMPKTYYLKVDGSDSEDGLSLEKAWANLSHAQYKLDAGDTLLIAAGTYYDNTFTAQNSGIPEAPITIKGFQGRPDFVATGDNIRSTHPDPEIRQFTFYDWPDPGPISFYNIEGLSIRKYTKSIFIYRKSHHINVTDVIFDECHIGFFAGRGAHHIISRDLSINASYWNGWCVWTRTHHIAAFDVHVTNQIEHFFFDIHSGDADPGMGHDYISIINCSGSTADVSARGVSGVYIGHGPPNTYDDNISIINFNYADVQPGHMFWVWAPGDNLYIDGAHSVGSQGMTFFDTGKNLVIRNVYVKIGDTVLDHGMYFCSIGDLDGVLIENVTVENVDYAKYYYDFNFESGFGVMKNVTLRNISGDNGDIKIFIGEGAPAGYHILEFTDGKIFTEDIIEIDPLYTPEKSYISLEKSGSYLIKLYPMTAKPETGSIAIAVNLFDASRPLGEIMIDISVSLAAGIRVDFGVQELMPWACYAAAKDGLTFAVCQAGSEGEISFSNSQWAGVNRICLRQTADTLAPQISEVIISNITETSATINWSTSEPAGGKVEYGKSANYGLVSPESAEMALTHSHILTSLESKSVYHFRLQNRDSHGNTGSSGDYTFMTRGTDNKIIVFPNPCIKGEKITFINLPREAILRIYNISGALLKEINHRSPADGGSEEWDVSGAAGGVYIYCVESGRSNQRGKISIVK